MQRDQVSAAVRDSLMKRAAEFNILVDDVAITHLSFGTEFTKAVESKQVAQQEAERARFVVMKADQVRGLGLRWSVGVRLSGCRVAAFCRALWSWQARNSGRHVGCIAGPRLASLPPAPTPALGGHPGCPLAGCRSVRRR